MKAPVILLFTNDPSVCQAAQDAVFGSRHGLRLNRSSQDAFRSLREGTDDVDLVIIDLDPGMHGAALLEATADRLPVLVLTSLEEHFMQPLAKRHGALACLAKPFTAERLAEMIAELLRPRRAYCGGSSSTPASTHS